MRIVLIGAVRSTESALRTLGRIGPSPVGVLTLPVERANRHSDYVDLGPATEALSIPLFRASSAASERAIEFLRSLEPELLLVVGWSEILPRHLLAVPSIGAIGYHPAPLPLMRGRAVIPWTILQSTARTAGTLFWLAEGVDDGDIAYQVGFDVHPRETATSLYQKHMTALEEMLYDLAACRDATDIPRTMQSHADATYCTQRRPEDGLIDWSKPATEVDRLVRATTRPYPGARALVERNRSELFIWETELIELPFNGIPGQVVTTVDGDPVVACGEGFLVLREVSDALGEPADLRVQDRFATYAAATVWRMWPRDQEQ
jgi:methionyl-tRNA formyltransferase